MSTDLVPVDVDRAKVLLAFGLNVRDPNAQAALLVCQRYDLDPLLKHVQLIKQAVYITRDGYLHVAHQSGVFDGMELDDEGETDTYYWAKVSVYRKDMSRPFSAKARCRKDEKVFGDPWDMAVTRAERRALKRAFDVSGLIGEGDYDEHEELFDRSTGEVTSPPPALSKPERTFEEPPLPESLTAEVVRPDPAPPQLGIGDGEPMSEPQKRKLFAMLAGAEIGDDDRHDFAGRVLGRQIDSFTELSVDDATALIDHLKTVGASA